MEQRDYILREIEKIGAVISAIRHKLFGGADNTALSVDAPEEVFREMLRNEAFLDLDELMALDAAATDEYLSGLKGFNTENIELLAATIADIGFTGSSGDAPMLLQKALQLCEICNRRDKTYSFAREALISRLREALQNGIQIEGTS